MGWWNFMRSKKVKVNTAQMGWVLYQTAIDRTLAALKENPAIEEAGLSGADRNYLFQEMVIINMFILITVFESREASDRQRDKIDEAVDMMHSLYFKELVDKFEFSNKEIKALQTYISQRYREYEDTIQSNRETNWLEALAKRVRNNLHGEVIYDAIGAMHMAMELASYYKYTPGLLKKYEIIG